MEKKRKGKKRKASRTYTHYYAQAAKARWIINIPEIPPSSNGEVYIVGVSLKTPCVSFSCVCHRVYVYVYFMYMYISCDVAFNRYCETGFVRCSGGWMEGEEGRGENETEKRSLIIWVLWSERAVCLFLFFYYADKVDRDFRYRY